MIYRMTIEKDGGRANGGRTYTATYRAESADEARERAWDRVRRSLLDPSDAARYSVVAEAAFVASRSASPARSHART